MPVAQPAQQRLTAPSPAELVALAAVGKRLPGLFQRRLGVRGGNALSHYRGRGVEYDESRHYQPGDSLRHLDARVTARRGEPYTKVYQEDRERALFLCVDDRACMHFATRGRFKRVIAAQAAALLGWKAFDEGNPIAARIVRDASVENFRLRRGRTALARMIHGLSVPAHRHSVNETQLAQSLQAGWAGLSRQVPSGALLVVLSDFRALDDAAEAQLLRARHHCQMLLLRIEDALERHLPQAAGRYPLANADGEATLFGGDSAAQARLSATLAQRDARVAALARSLRAPVFDLATDCVPAEQLNRLLHRRA